MTNEEKRRIHLMPFVPFSPNEAIEYWEIKEEQELTRKPLSFDDEPLTVEPFFSGLEDRIIQYRRHLLGALGAKNHNGNLRLSKNKEVGDNIVHSWVDLTNEFINTSSDQEFFDKIEDHIF